MMFLSYARMAVRNFKRNRSSFLINLSGLTIGLATCLVAGLYIKHEFRTDRFHTDIDNIYRLQTQFKTWNFSGTPYPLTETLQQNFPQVTAGLRTLEKNLFVRVGEHEFRHDVIFADPAFFSFFTFPLKQGDPRSALGALRQVVISEDIQRQYFADTEPVGKVIRIRLGDRSIDFEVSGVARPVPSWSSIDFDFVIPLENHFAGAAGAREEWTNLFITSFVKVPQDRIAEVVALTPDAVKKHLREEDAEQMAFVFKAFAQHHLGEGTGGGGLKQGRSMNGLYVVGGVSLLILALACFNFMNLANAQSSKRIVEVGIRKVVGAQRVQLVQQFLMESVITAMAAAALSFAVAELSLFLFRDLLDASLTVFSIDNGDVLACLIAVTLVTGALAGSYPAVVLARTSAGESFKRQLKVTGNNWLSRLVLSLQFTVTMALIAGAIVMWRQQRFLLNKDLGYNQQQVLVVPFANADRPLIDVFNNQVKSLPEVVNSARTDGSFTRGNNAALVELPDQSRSIVFIQAVDEAYLQTMEMRLIRGEGFSEMNAADTSKVIVNESFVKRFGLQDSVGMPLGRRLVIHNPTIVGVVKDFHNNSLHSAIEPLMFRYWNPASQGDAYVVIRLHSGQIASGIDKVRNIWKSMNTGSPFEFFFLDEDVEAQYASERRWSAIITVLTAIAIFLSALGLVGLAMFTAAQRRKEIGIRKVLGASVLNVIAMLSKSYVVLICLSFLIAAPLSFYLLQHFWLSSFPYHIAVDALTYALTLIVVAGVVALSIGGLTVKAALANPSETLKEE